MPGPAARASVSVPGRSVRPGRSPAVPGRGDSFGPVRDRIGDRHSRDRSRACRREFLVVARPADGDRGQAPHVEEAPQVLVTGGVVRGIYRTVVLAEELLALSFGEVTQDHQRIGVVFRRLCGHGLSLRPPAVLSPPAAPARMYRCCRTAARSSTSSADRLGPAPARNPAIDLISKANEISGSQTGSRAA